MKPKQVIISLATMAVFAGITGCAFADEDNDKQDNHKSAELEAKAKISKADAEQIALAKVPNGSVKEGEIEKEKGKLIWSFDITTPDSKDITEVNVNAITGHLVSMEWETPEDQANEKDEDSGKEEGGDKD